jgi:4-amino-4-deoxy-L-arabinose transferase-like glycosyltransferase
MTLLSRLSSSWKAWLLLALLTFTAAVPGVFFVPALDRDESRFAQASKQMLETGDFIQIRYQDEGRNKKPAGIHWLQAGSTKAFAGELETQIWSYRLPSLFGAVLATLAVFWCGIALIGRRGAFLGAAMFGSGLLLTSEAHIAKTDAVLVCLTALTMGALARLYMQAEKGKGGGRRGLGLLFWAAMGLGFLIKGPVTMLVAGLTLLALWLARRDTDWMKRLLDWRGLLLFGLLVLPWFIWVQLATSGEFLEGAVGKDLKDKLVGASEGHGGLPGYHLLFVVTHFFPATLLLIPSLVLLVKTLRGRALDVLASERSGLIFLAAWLVPTWIFFELLPTKLSHYILPAYPALALICGWGAVQLMGQLKSDGGMYLSRLASVALFSFGGLALCLATSPFGVELLQLDAARGFQAAAREGDVLNAWWQLPDMKLHWLGLGLLMVLAAAGFGAGRRYGASLCLGILASIFLGWHIRTIFLPGAVWMQPTTTARLALAETCSLKAHGLLYLKSCRPPFPARVQAVGYAEPSLVFTTGTHTTIPPQTQVTLPETEAGYPVVYLLNLEDEAGREADIDLSALAKAAGRQISRSEPHYALNYSNGDPVVFVSVRID